MCAVQTGERITSVDTLQDIDELYVTEVRLWLSSLEQLTAHDCCTSDNFFACLLMCLPICKSVLIW